MSKSIARFALAALLVAPMLAQGQTQPLPSQIKGRWTFQARLSNIFSLSEVKASQEGTFTAKLEWWTANTTCSILGEGITGKITDRGISWELVTKAPCNAPYAIELVRVNSGWEGKAVGKDNNVVVDLKAE